MTLSLSYRSFKKYIKEYLDVESWKFLMQHANEKIQVTSYIRQNLTGCEVGAYHRLDELAPKYLDRSIQALQLPPGNYEALFKMGADGAIHRWYQWIYGPEHRGSTPYLNIVLVGVFSLFKANLFGLRWIISGG